MRKLAALNKEIVDCTRCRRLIKHCQKSADNPPKRFAAQTYWGGPVPGFGDPKARVLIVGLAPAANGANRTGRMFTGDRSGDWLYGALHRAGFASQAESTSRRDGLKLTDIYITAAAHCAPPDNKPTRAEMDACAPYLDRELEIFKGLKVVLALGGIAWNTYLAARQRTAGDVPRPRPKFGHCATHRFDDVLLIGSYHPSQQNTFTKRLTVPMFDRVFSNIRKELARKMMLTG